MTTPLPPRGRLAEMHWLVSDARLPEDDASLTAASRQRGPRVTPASSLRGRKGYDAGFLGEFVVDWPQPTPSRSDDVLPIGADALQALAYTHFSVMMSRSRRMAWCVGVNLSGAASVAIDRGPDHWSFDGRLPLEAQLGEELYADNLLDRGHLVRRQDPNWGAEAAQANADTFHFTNCSPQMSAFNQKTWLSLEDYILDNARTWRMRVSVFSGPVFREDDRVYRGVSIPSAYWKVVAFLSDKGLPSATAYLIDQTRELSALEFTFGRLKTYQVSVLRIESLTGLSFGELARYDGFSNEELSTGATVEQEIGSAADVRW